MFSNLIQFLLFLFLLFVVYNLYYDNLYPTSDNTLRRAWKTLKDFISKYFRQ